MKKTTHKTHEEIKQELHPPFLFLCIEWHTPWSQTCTKQIPTNMAEPFQETSTLLPMPSTLHDEEDDYIFRPTEFVEESIILETTVAEKSSIPEAPVSTTLASGALGDEEDDYVAPTVSVFRPIEPDSVEVGFFGSVDDEEPAIEEPTVEEASPKNSAFIDTEAVQSDAESEESSEEDEGTLLYFTKLLNINSNLPYITVCC